MINLLTDDLPKTVLVDGKEYKIYTDFRDYIELHQMLIDKRDDSEIYLYIQDLFIDEIPDDFVETIKAINEFKKGNTANQPKGNAVKSKSKYVFSFLEDAPYIIGGFRECYGIDLLHIKYMHWWEFNALLESLNESCELKKRIYYRSIDLSTIKNKEERNRIKKIQRSIAISVKEISDEDIANAF